MKLKKHTPFSLILYILMSKLNILVSQGRKTLIEMFSSNREESYF